MDFTINNGLSMTGGDDLSSISSSIAVLDAAVVHKVGSLNESIDGNKTFTDTTTFIGNISANSQNITPTELGFIAGLTSDAQTQINAKADDAAVVHLAGAENISGAKNFQTTTTFTNITATAGTATNTLSAVGVGGINVITGETNQIQYNGTDRINIGSTTTTMNNTTTNIQSGGTTKITTNATTTTLNNTTINLQDNTPTTRFTQNNGTTTLTNGTINLRDNATTTRFTQTNTTTTLRNTTINLQDNTPTTRFTQNNGTTTITNPTINNVASTAFNVTDGTTNRLAITPTTTTTTTKITEDHRIGELATLTSGTFDVTDLVTSQKLLTLNDTFVKLQAPNNISGELQLAATMMKIDGTAVGGSNQLYIGSIEPMSVDIQNGRLGVLNGDISITNDSTNTTNARSIGISVLSSMTADILFSLFKRTGTGSSFAGTGFRMVRENATNNFLFQQRIVSSGGLGTNTTIQSINSTGTTETFTCATQTKVATTAFKVQNVAGTDKLNISPSLTTITNTNVDVVAPLHATSFNLGTTASAKPLTCYVFNAQRLISTQGISTGGILYDMYFQNNTSSTLICPPNARPITQRANLYFNNGTITGGGVMTATLTMTSSAGGALSTSSPFTITSGAISLVSVAMPRTFTPNPNDNLRIRVLITSTAAITASTKTMFAQVHCSLIV